MFMLDLLLTHLLYEDPSGLYTDIIKMHTSATYKGPNPLQQNAYEQHLACLNHVE